MGARRRRRPSVSIRTQCMFRLLHGSLITTGPRFGDPHLDRGILFPILSTVVCTSHLGLEFGSVSHSGISVSRPLSESVNREEGQVQSASYRRFWQAAHRPSPPLLLKRGRICIFVFEWRSE